MDWAAFLRAHNLEHLMSRHGNCHDSAVAEILFNLIKRERIRRRTCRTRAYSKQDMFDDIEMFYNPVRLLSADLARRCITGFPKDGSVRRQSGA
ncbi:putative transposase [Paracoccus alcaliphilus]|uniref:Putative transposase n=1 Tax=Paracoccus alcaliphilus TaxID=34002 RepID=A0A1H8HDW1_9RHOB|nr:putative transposase [Paracoccus alcaliphilus]